MQQTEAGKVDMDVVVAKIMTILIITALTVLCGLVPCRLMQHCAKSMIRRRRLFDYILCGAKCFSGGVFLGTCFLHLIPETRNKVDSVLEQIGSRSRYPVAELLTIAGFFGVIFGEHFIRFLYYKSQEESCFPTYDHDRYDSDLDFLPPAADDSALNGCDIECRSLKSLTRSNTANSQEVIQLNPNERHDNRVHREESVNGFGIELEIEPSPPDEMEVKTVVTELSRNDEGKGHVRSALLLSALSFYGVFEGMALGLQSLESDVWVMCIAISIHRGILAFGMSMEHARQNDRPATIVFVISAFAIICAVGIVIGISISAGAQLYSDVNVPNAILQSLATGTIFYIIFLKILYKELDSDGKDVKKISCTFVGFSFMAVVFAVAKQ